MVLHSVSKNPDITDGNHYNDGKLSIGFCLSAITNAGSFLLMVAAFTHQVVTVDATIGRGKQCHMKMRRKKKCKDETSSIRKKKTKT